MPTEKFQFEGEGGHQLAAALDLPDGQPGRLCAVRALLHLRQGRAGGEAHCGGARGQGHRHAALRLHRPRLERRRFRQFDLLLQCRRSRPRRRSSARDAEGARDPDRPQPRGRRDPRCRRPDRRKPKPWSPSQHRPIPRMSPACSGIMSTTSAHRARRRSRSPAGPSPSSANSSTTSPKTRLMEKIAHLHKALLVMHSPTDDTVGIDNATRIFVTAKHPKSFVSLLGRRSSAQRPARFRLCRRHDRGLGDALCRSCHRGACRRDDRQAAAGRGARDPQQQIPEHGLDRPASSARRRASLRRRRRYRPRSLRFPARRSRRLQVHDHAALRRPQILSARARHRDAEATARSTPRIARNARPRKACSTRSMSRSASKARSMPTSASASSKSRTNARCTARSPRKFAS